MEALHEAKRKAIEAKGQALEQVDTEQKEIVKKMNALQRRPEPKTTKGKLNRAIKLFSLAFKITALGHQKLRIVATPSHKFGKGTHESGIASDDIYEENIITGEKRTLFPKGSTLPKDFKQT